MSAVVQATCPGCKQVLRIPSEWLGQPFRCKHCQTIIQARAPAPPVRSVPPAPAPPPVVSKPTPLPRPAPAALPIAALLPPTPLVATPVATPVAARPGYIAPAALPVASPAKAAPAALPVASPTPSTIPMASPMPRPRRRSAILPLFIGLVLLGGSAAATVAFWPQIAPLFENQDRDVFITQNDPPPLDEDKEKNKTSVPIPPKDKDRADTPDPNKDKRPFEPNKDRRPIIDPNKDRRPIDPNKDRRPIDPNKDRSPNDPSKDRVVKKTFNGAFPRRALVVSVNNYLFANPVTSGDSAPNSRNLQGFMSQLTQPRSWRMAPNQTCLLSDAAKGTFQPASPIKPTIESTVTAFLKSSRAQDRIVLMFIAHAVELEDKAYIAPIDADLTVAGSMIPLDWVYKQLEECPAKQKLLILDVCRFNTAKGEERPSSGPMGAKFDLALKNPPMGVQVWTSCTEGQRSYELEDGAQFNNGVFFDALYSISVNGVDVNQAKPEDEFPLERMVARVNGHMKGILGPHKLEQTSRLSGQMKEGGPAFDPEEKSAPDPVVVAPIKKNATEESLVRTILRELNVPPIKKQQAEGLLRYEALPPIAAETLDKYPVDNTPSKLREAVEHAQAVLWAVSPQVPPPEVADAVNKIRASGEIKADLGTLQEVYKAPPAGNANAENQFKDRVFADTRRVASILLILEEELKNMEDAAKMKKDAPKRWQANYDFMLARLQAQIAYIYEYASMLGAMRKELPARDPAVHSGWRLASRKKMQGDGTGRKLARDAEKILEKLAQEHAGTPWEILAKREKFTALGLEWKPN